MKRFLRPTASIALAALAIGFVSCSSYQVGFDRSKEQKEIEEETAELMGQGGGRSGDINNPYDRGY